MQFYFSMKNVSGKVKSHVSQRKVSFTWSRGCHCYKCSSYCDCKKLVQDLVTFFKTTLIWHMNLLPGGHVKEFADLF